MAGWVADHERAWAKHQTLSAAEHVAAARDLRAERVGLLRPAPPADQVEICPLSDYDAALGLTDEAAEDMAGGVA
jgi:hypothetical protein